MINISLLLVTTKVFTTASNKPKLLRKRIKIDNGDNQHHIDIASQDQHPDTASVKTKFPNYCQAFFVATFPTYQDFQKFLADDEFLLQLKGKSSSQRQDGKATEKNQTLKKHFNKLYLINILMKPSKSIFRKNVQKEDWMKAFIKEIFGCRSCITSQTESKHSRLKKYVTSRKRLTKLFKILTKN